MPLLMARILVVPRKGDVDRNIMSMYRQHVLTAVVPRKGDVDRNGNLNNYGNAGLGRPPQGGRG